MRQHRVTGAVEPLVTVGRHAGLLDVGDQPSTLVVGHPVTGRGLDGRQVVNADHPQRAAHRQMFDQRAPLVKRVVEVGDGETWHPGPQRQVGRGGVGGMQADEIAGDPRYRIS